MHPCPGTMPEWQLSLSGTEKTQQRTQKTNKKFEIVFLTPFTQANKKNSLGVLRVSCCVYRKMWAEVVSAQHRPFWVMSRLASPVSKVFDCCQSREGSCACSVRLIPGSMIILKAIGLGIWFKFHFLTLYSGCTEGLWLLYPAPLLPY